MANAEFYIPFLHSAFNIGVFMSRTEIRIALPSKGILAENTLDLLSSAGLGVYKPNTEGMVIPEPCSLYFYVKDPASLVTGHNFEDHKKGYCENTFART